MPTDPRTREQILLEELDALRQRVSELETSEREYKSAQRALLVSEEKARRLYQEQAVLAEIGRIISSSLNIDEVYKRFSDEVRKLLDFDLISINTLDLDSNTMRIGYHSGLEVSTRRRGDQFSLEGTLAEEAARRQSAVIIQGVGAEEIGLRYKGLVPLTDIGQKSFMSAPLISKDKVIGALGLCASKPDAYSDSDKQILERVCTQIAGAVAISQLYANLQKTEEARRESNERFALAVQGSNDGLWDWIIPQEGNRFADDNPFYFSPRFKELLGYEDHEIPNVFGSLKTYTHPEDYERVLSSCVAHLDRKEPFDHEVRLRLRSGEYRWFRSRGQAIWDNDIPVRMAGSIRDIDDRVQVQQALAESESRFRDLAENIKEVFWLRDLKTNEILYVSPGYEEIWGRTRSSLYEDSSSWLESIHPEDREAGQISFPFSDGVEEFQREFRVVRTDGSIRWILNRGFPVRNDSGETYEIAGIAEDITERKLTAEALRDSEELLRSIADSSPDYIMRVSIDGEIQFINRAGPIHPVQEVLGTNLCNYLSEEHCQVLLDCFARVINTARPDRCEIEYEHVDGRMISYEMRVGLVLKGEEVVAFIVHSTDVTERKQLERQFLQAQKMEVVGQLAGGIAHDFNNLLSAIISYAHLGASRLSSGDPVRGYLQEIQTSGERASNLTRQLLTFSRHQIVESRVLNLNDLVLGLVRMLTRLIGENIELVVLPNSDPGLVRIDPGQIEQVILNLVVNARDAMPNGGKLTLDLFNVTLSEEDAKKHAVLEPGEYVLLCVSDTGMGIRDDVKQHIFDPFFTTKEVGKGTGLGLSTCYAVVNKAKGYIEVDSAVDEGTTFKIYLPRVDEPIGRSPLRDDSGFLPHGSETILLVEDEPSVRSVAGHILQEQGYTVLEAANGTEALRIAEEHAASSIDLILTDVVMPLLGGMELVNQLVQMHPEARVLYTSGYMEDAHISEHISQAAHQFLQKPFTPAMLTRYVRETLDTCQPQC